MFDEINRQLAESKLKVRQKAKWQQRVTDLETEVERERRKRDHCQKQLLKEQKDVDQLTGLSFGALFFSLIGKKEAKLTKEQQELLQAKLAFEGAVETVQVLEAEIDELTGKLSSLQGVEQELQDLLEKKEALIRVRHPQLAHQLHELSDRETALHTNLRELKEAATAGRSVLNTLKKAKELLDSAKSWGTWDMIGGGVIATAIKHSRIDQARSAIHSAQRSLRRFEKELKDVQQELAISIEIDGLLTFADYFFDDIFTDLIVQGRISDSLRQIHVKQRQIKRVVSGLDDECRKTEQELAEIRDGVAALIENA